MTQEYRVRHLTSSRLAQAYPLVRDVMGHPSLERWIEYAQPLVDDDTPKSKVGILVAERGDYIRGMFSYQILPCLAHVRVLYLQDFAVLEMAGRESIVEALVDASRVVAKGHDCLAVHAQVPRDAQWALDYLTQREHKVENMGLCFQLAQAN